MVLVLVSMVFKSDVNPLGTFFPSILFILESCIDNFNNNIAPKNIFSFTLVFALSTLQEETVRYCKSVSSE